jgi:uncharacterized membrane protein YqjE
MSTNVHYINEQPHHHGNGRSIGSTVNEVKEEFKQFAETRIAMLQAEMKEKMAAIKASAPMLAIGALMGLVSFLVLTGALICILRLAFGDSPYAWFLSFLIVGVVYAIVGGGAFFLGYQNITKSGLAPERTIKVLKDDKVWLQNEARTQL